MIERLPPEERPDELAVYPSWIHLAAVAVEFEQLYVARLDEDLAVGGDTAVVYAARYDSVGPGDTPADSRRAGDSR